MFYLKKKKKDNCFNLNKKCFFLKKTTLYSFLYFTVFSSSAKIGNLFLCRGFIGPHRKSKKFLFWGFFIVNSIGFV